MNTTSTPTTAEQGRAQHTMTTDSREAPVQAASISQPKRVSIPRNGVDYRGKVVLAPMVRSGELPSRLMALKYGADLVWGPETIDRALIGANVRHNTRTGTIDFTRTPSNGGRKKDNNNDDTQEQAPPTEPEQPLKESVIYRLHPTLEANKLIFQLGTASPTLAVQAATLVAPYVSGIDLNSGCPKPFSTSGGMGAALLSTPDLLCDILTALVRDVGNKFEIGISVKIRLLSTPEETRALVERLVKTGITGLTIHCRTRAMRKTEKAIRVQLRMIGEICRDAGVACLVNGDVLDREHGLALAAEYSVDGAMIATAAESNPSVFRSAADGGKAEWREVCEAYMRAAIAVENRWGNTKFLLAQMMPGKEQGWRGLGQARNYEDVCVRLEFGEDLVEEARKLDKLLGLTERETKSTQKAMKKEAQKGKRDARKGGDDRNHGEDRKNAKAKRPVEEEMAKSTAEVADRVVAVEEDARAAKRQRQDEREVTHRREESPGHSKEYLAEVRQEVAPTAMAA